MALSAEDAFRRLTIGEPGFLFSLVDEASEDGGHHALDCRTESLLRVATLIAIDAGPASYRSAVDGARQAGASLDDLLAVLVAVADQVGSARVASAAPRIAIAAGYDVEVALEELDRHGPVAG
jgi:alkylhydroperoxidase/carboxymuconolactone decarboxylase family protein YurZ